MKVVYILKKGFHCYPPCLAQLLYLNDMGVDLKVYHGEESEKICKILDERGIEHHLLQSDRQNNTSLQRAVTLLKYRKEVRKIIKNTPPDSIIWYGNCESAMVVGNLITSHKYVLSILELYDPGSMYDKFMKKYINKAEAVLCCEKHRAAIMKVYYNMTKIPYVLPNKPYELEDTLKPEELSDTVKEKIEKIKDKFVVLYQGIVTPDRPLDKISKALRIIDDDNIVFVVMGKASDAIKKELTDLYANTVFMDYIPSPQHLLVTQYANIGIANYDYSNLNNLFCAPNKIYEYSKFGLPMITSENIGLSETVGEFGAAVCVDFLDVEQIVCAVKKIRDDHQTYSDNAKKFYYLIDNFNTIKKVINNLEKNEN